MKLCDDHDDGLTHGILIYIAVKRPTGGVQQSWIFREMEVCLVGAAIFLQGRCSVLYGTLWCYIVISTGLLEWSLDIERRKGTTRHA